MYKASPYRVVMLLLLILTPSGIHAQTGSEKTKEETTLLTGKVIDPQVVDPRGQVVAGALVLGDYNAELDAGRRLDPRITSTASDGTFKMRREAAPIILEAISHDGRTAGIARVAQDQAEVTIHVGPLAKASGRLLDRTGKPVTIGSIRYNIRIPEDRSPQSGFTQFCGSVAIFDADGKFTLTGLVPGEQYLLDYVYRADWPRGASTTVGTFAPTAAGSFHLDDIVFRPRDPLPHPPCPEGDELERALHRQRVISDYLAHAATGTEFDLIVQRTVGTNFDDALPAALAYWLQRVPGLKQRNTGLDRVHVDLVDFKQAKLSEVFVVGWLPKCPLFARLKVESGGRQLDWGDKNVTMLGVELAKVLQKKVGDEIELYSEKFQIVGIYESPLAEENSGLIVGLEDLERLIDRPGEVSAILITAERPIDDAGLEALRRRIEVVQPGLDVTSARPLKLDTPAQPPSAEQPTPGGKHADSPAKN